MENCPFLSTYEIDVKCFKNCALYNYKLTGGICPFKKIDDFRISRIENRRNEMELYKEELNFIRKSYLEASNQYL